MSQPIIRGIQAVGAVDITYTYNGKDNTLNLPDTIQIAGQSGGIVAKDIPISGFRLDGEFLRAVQQIASSVQIPILGGGAIALTNNNRSGTLNINATRVSTPQSAKDNTSNPYGSMLKGTGVGPLNDTAYDLTLIAQIQQAQPGGDSIGATIDVAFTFNNLVTTITFEGCTIASVDPVGLSGNDASNYNISINYLNWLVNHSASQGAKNTSAAGATAGGTNP